MAHRLAVGLTTPFLLVVLLLSTPRILKADGDDQLTSLLAPTPLANWPASWRKPAPDLVSPDVRTGMPISLKRDLAGHVVLINFWATWCPPCRKEMPSLQALYAEFKDRGFVVLGVNVREASGASRSKWFAEQWGLTFPMLAADTALDFYRIYPIPHSYLIDRKGRLISDLKGPTDWTAPALKKLITFLLVGE